jgi:hypothetical protein
MENLTWFNLVEKLKEKIASLDLEIEALKERVTTLEG